MTKEFSNCPSESRILQGGSLIEDLLRDYDWNDVSCEEDVSYYDEESLMNKQQDDLTDPWEVNEMQLPWEVEESCYEYELG